MKEHKELIEALRNPDHPNYREVAEEAANILESPSLNGKRTLILNEVCDPPEPKTIEAHVVLENQGLGVAIGLEGYGLCDMSGNVFEWCQDMYGKDYYRKSPDVDPQGPSTGSYRVLRGGSWGSIAWFCRAAFRFRLEPDDRYHRYGFRLVCSQVNK